MPNKFILSVKQIVVVASLLVCCIIPVLGQEMLWGVTSEGGASGAGAIFKTNADGTNLEVKKSLTTIAGRTPQYTRLIQAPNGKLYGMTFQGGGSMEGVLFEFDPVTSAYEVKVDFGGIKGSFPNGSLIIGNDGKIYGMTSAGGANNKGVIFDYDASAEIFRVRHDFDGPEGEAPMGDLIQMPDGTSMMYGVTYQGGASDHGVLFSFHPQTGVFEKKKDFGGAGGADPIGSLMLASTTKLYGMASNGGTGGMGTIYEYDVANNSLTTKFDFSGTTSGRSPTGHLIRASNDLLYGLTLGGGTTDQGVLFEFNPSNSNFTKKIDFGGVKGIAPYGSLVQATNGKVYGTIEQGLQGYGGIFEYTISSNTLLPIVAFDAGPTGISSRGTLIQAADLKLYGMTSGGGLGGDGVLFVYDIGTSGYQVKLNFNSGQEGIRPLGGLVQGSNGRIYGTTYDGSGTLFEYNISTGEFSKKIDLSFEKGTNPISALTLAQNGKLYGVTRFGGDSNSGVVFEYDPSGNVYVKKQSFSSTFGTPIGSLVQLPDGKFYGVTESGGNTNEGILYQYDPATNAITKKIDFAAGTNGSSPSGTLLLNETKLYGLTNKGGANNEGVLFEYDPTNNSLTVKKHFAGAAAGANPVAGLMKATNNKFYGITKYGGAYNWGVIFEFDPSNGDFSKFDLSGDLEGGVDVNGGLVQSSNGKLYGTTAQGGVENVGVFFEYDIQAHTYTKKADFTGANGGRPFHGPMLFVHMENQSVTFNELPEKTTDDVPFELTAVSTSGMPVSFTSSNTSVATVTGSTLHIEGPGTTTITAQQLGSINYHPSAPVERMLTVTMVVVGTETYEDIRIYPYPNPANHEFTIEFEHERNVTKEGFILVDALGRSTPVSVERLDDFKYTCNTRDVPPGLYFIFFADSLTRRPIMIQH
jgi:uncharacterized repeat protein (TIGR03803 family)